MVEKFEVGKYYRTIKEPCNLPEHRSPSHWGGIKTNAFEHGQIRKCLSVKKHDEYPECSVVDFQGVECSPWNYYADEFEEVIEGAIIKVTDKIKTFCDDKKEVENMELKEINKKNLAEAKKQFETERMNEEIEFAKKKLREATDNLNRLDREINNLTEQKKPWLEIVKEFDKK